MRTGLEGAGLTKTQKILYCILVVGGRYAWARLQLISAFQRWGDRQRVNISEVERPNSQIPGITLRLIITAFLVAGNKF